MEGDVTAMGAGAASIPAHQGTQFKLVPSSDAGLHMDMTLTLLVLRPKDRNYSSETSASQEDDIEDEEPGDEQPGDEQRKMTSPPQLFDTLLYQPTYINLCHQLSFPQYQQL